MEGYAKVEKYMSPVNKALEKRLTGSAKTECYNRCYEAVMNAIMETEKENIGW